MMGYITAGALFLLLVLEYLFPFMENDRGRIRHYLKNLLVSIPNGLFLAGVASVFTAGVIQASAAHQWGVLRWMELPTVVEWFLALFLFDGWMYLWHRLNHSCSALWFFHRFHHVDPAMDCTTAVRFHFGEIFISSLVRIGVISLLGMELSQFLAYELLMFPVIAFHHSNIKVPVWLDRGISWIIASPSLHRVHHSVVIEETNSNYGTVLSLWDRWFKSLHVRHDQDKIIYGVE